jgi:CelD/BcsL family acetyltransferase involved in cellulose biosynthesis
VERRFQEDFVRVAMARGWLRLWVMEAEGTPIASLLGYRFAGADYSYQAGRDPEREALRVGLVMDLTAMRATVEDGIPEYRMLRGDESYKLRYTKLDSPVHNLAYARTIRGRAATAATTYLRRRAERRDGDGQAVED